MNRVGAQQSRARWDSIQTFPRAVSPLKQWVSGLPLLALLSFWNGYERFAMNWKQPRGTPEKAASQERLDQARLFVGLNVLDPVEDLADDLQVRRPFSDAAPTLQPRH